MVIEVPLSVYVKLPNWSAATAFIRPQRMISGFNQLVLP